MNVEDLIPIGRLSASPKRNDLFLKFNPNRCYESLFLEHNRDLFLIFADHSVRFVTLDRFLKEKVIWILLQDKEVIAEVKKTRSVQLAVSNKDRAELYKKFKDSYLIGFSVFYEDKCLGLVSDVFSNNAQNVISFLDHTGKEIMIPDVPYYILDKDKNSKKVILQNASDLLRL